MYQPGDHSCCAYPAVCRTDPRVARRCRAVDQPSPPQHAFGLAVRRFAMAMNSPLLDLMILLVPPYRQFSDHRGGWSSGASLPCARRHGSTGTGGSWTADDPQRTPTLRINRVFTAIVAAIASSGHYGISRLSRPDPKSARISGSSFPSCERRRCPDHRSESPDASHLCHAAYNPPPALEPVARGSYRRYPLVRWRLQYDEYDGDLPSDDRPARRTAQISTVYDAEPATISADPPDRVPQSQPEPFRIHGGDYQVLAPNARPCSDWKMYAATNRFILSATTI